MQMALQAGSSQAFRAPLTPESLEGTRRARQEGKKSVGETNLSSLDAMSNKDGGKLDHLKEWPAVLARGASSLTLVAGMVSRVTRGCGVTAWCWPGLFITSFFASPATLSSGSCWQMKVSCNGKSVLCSSSTLPHPSHPLVLKVQLTNTQVSPISICSQKSFLFLEACQWSQPEGHPTDSSSCQVVAQEWWSSAKGSSYVVSISEESLTHDNTWDGNFWQSMPYLATPLGSTGF